MIARLWSRYSSAKTFLSKNGLKKPQTAASESLTGAYCLIFSETRPAAKTVGGGLPGLGGLFSCNHREIHTLTQTSEGKKRGGNIVRPREWNGHHLPRRSRSREVDEKVSGSISMDLPAFSRNPRPLPLPLPLPLPPSIVGAGSLGGGEGLA